MTTTATATEPVRCRGCKRQVGLATGVHNGVFCDEACRDDIPATEYEGRDAIISLLAARGTARSALGAEFDLSKQRISQILTGRL